MAIFQYGIFFDLPVLTLLLGATIWLRPRLSKSIAGGRGARLVAFCGSAIVLTSLEENINCGQFDCQTSLWPPTMPFLLAFTALMGAIGAVLKVKQVGRLVAFACLLGLVFEMTLGGSAAAFRALQPVWLLAIIALTLVSYACIFYLPLRLLLDPLPVDLNSR